MVIVAIFKKNVVSSVMLYLWPEFDIQIVGYGDILNKVMFQNYRAKVKVAVVVFKKNFVTVLASHL